jgi:hypothetical protein
MVLVSIVTAPVNAMARPQVILAPVVIVMLAPAMMVPAKVEFVPSVAEVPTAHHTSLGSARLVNRTAEPLAVVSVVGI